MKTSLTPIQQERLNDLRQLSNHGGRDQWHGLRCHHISGGQFTATYADIAARWGVTASVVYSTIKRFIKLGLIATERFERATLFTLIQSSDSSDQSDLSDQSDCSVATGHDSKEVTKPKRRSNRGIKRRGHSGRHRITVHKIKKHLPPHRNWASDDDS